jgi:hypothetical protein
MTRLLQGSTLESDDVVVVVVDDGVVFRKRPGGYYVYDRGGRAKPIPKRLDLKFSKFKIRK